VTAARHEHRKLGTEAAAFETASRDNLPSAPTIHFGTMPNVDALGDYSAQKKIRPEFNDAEDQ
jgi:hypothetical protein